MTKDKTRSISPSRRDFITGLRGGLPIAVAYISVSFAFGITAVSQGLPVWSAVAISLLNLTSAGQVAGVPLIVSGAPMIEMILTQFFINLRYSLMSLSLGQKLAPSVGLGKRFAISYGITDEIFAFAASRNGLLSGSFMAGLIIPPVVGWISGTLLGAVASDLLPAIISDALGIAIYGMFIGIVMEPAKKMRSVTMVSLTAIIFSLCFHYLPLLNKVSEGFALIIAAVGASALGALLFPVAASESEEKKEETPDA